MAKLIGIPSLPKLASPKGQLNNLLAMGQAKLWAMIRGDAPWGVWLHGTNNKMVVDSVLEVEISEESHVMDYRIQTGSFSTYNKVQMPYEVKIRLIRCGNTTENNAFLNWIQNSTREVLTYDIQVPERKYNNCTLISYSIERKKENGVNVIVCDCVFREVREVPKIFYSKETDLANTQNAVSPMAKPTKPTSRVQAIKTEIVEKFNQVKGIFTKAKQSVTEFIK